MYVWTDGEKGMREGIEGTSESESGAHLLVMSRPSRVLMQKHALVVVPLTVCSRPALLVHTETQAHDASLNFALFD